MGTSTPDKSRRVLGLGVARGWNPTAALIQLPARGRPSPPKSSGVLVLARTSTSFPSFCLFDSGRVSRLQDDNAVSENAHQGAQPSAKAIGMPVTGSFKLAISLLAARKSESS